MNRNVYDDWNADGTLPEMKSCPFCRGKAILCDNGYERPVMDQETGAYIDMDMFDGDVFWCECPECGAESGYADDPKKAIALWNRRDNPPNTPLTLDEMLEMEGELVWVETPEKSDDCNGLSMVKLSAPWKSGGLKPHVLIVSRNGDRNYAELLMVGFGGKIYRIKPKEEAK